MWKKCRLYPPYFVSKITKDRKELHKIIAPLSAWRQRSSSNFFKFYLIIPQSSFLCLCLCLGPTVWACNWIKLHLKKKLIKKLSSTDQRSLSPPQFKILHFPLSKCWGKIITAGQVDAFDDYDIKLTSVLVKQKMTGLNNFTPLLKVKLFYL